MTGKSVDYLEGHERGVLAAKFPKGFTCSCRIDTSNDYRHGFADGFDYQNLGDIGKLIEQFMEELNDDLFD